ncbi:hypothetical protein [Chromobacterium sp. IIBBL 290-4]|uniref:hypothetical protein n=1 Tax=Chromobacterium sp. IIBBL 290-4 TaxID=2953890 RepID=UPI0020B87907|nr:hypothetical protein [Chromobacterium sp. IIBBL 290-4]UTH72725.1 hypothetical protein NKT35_14385 [Chromobacterium sp. IIBBL 290-4]
MRAATTLGFILTVTNCSAALAFDLGSVLNSVNQAVDTVKSVGSAVSSDKTGNGALSPKIKLTQPSPVASPLPVKEERSPSYKELDQLTVFLSRPRLNNDGSVRVAKSELLRGQVYKNVYEHPETQSTLQVWEAYQRQLKQDGYQLDFICDKPCANSTSLWETAQNSRFIIYNDSDRYLVAHKGNIWTSIAVGEIGYPLSSVNVVVRNN